MVASKRLPKVTKHDIDKLYGWLLKFLGKHPYSAHATGRKHQSPLASTKLYCLLTEAHV